jgi:hypothetical protein
MHGVNAMYAFSFLGEAKTARGPLVSGLSKGKSLQRPLRYASWESVLECARWELKQAANRGDLERVSALKKTIGFAKKHLRGPFPIEPAGQTKNV